MASVPGQFIHLINLPVLYLKHLAQETDTSFPANADKYEIVRRLAQLPKATVEELAGGRLYAGQTSVNWVRLVGPVEEEEAVDADGNVTNEDSLGNAFDGDPVEMSALKDALRTVVGADPFAAQTRPNDVTTAPKVVEAIELDNDRVLLTFVVAKRVNHVIHNFQLEVVYDDEFFVAILHLSRGVLEVRTSAARTRRLVRSWLPRLLEQLGRVAIPVTISKANYEALKERLGARGSSYRGKAMKGSIYDTREVTKGDCPDLFVEDEFKKEMGGYQPITVDLLFDHDEVGEVRMSVSTREGSIFFRRPVPDEVIELVSSALADIKAT
jgi:hypothetical protein